MAIIRVVVIDKISLESDSIFIKNGEMIPALNQAAEMLPKESCQEKGI